MNLVDKFTYTKWWEMINCKFEYASQHIKYVCSFLPYELGLGEWGMRRVSPFSSPILIYLQVTLSIPNGDEKLNPITVLDGFKYPYPPVKSFFQ